MTTSILIELSAALNVIKNHYINQAMIYRKIEIFLLFSFVSLILLNALMQFDGAQRADSVDLTTAPINIPRITYKPKEVKIGSKDSQKEIVAYLKSADYSEFHSVNSNFAPGSFQTSKTSLHLKTDFPGLPSDLVIFWSKNLISKIVADGRQVDSAELEPKKIVNLVYSIETDADNDFAQNYPVIRVPVRNFELENSVVQVVFCASEGRCDVPFSIKGTIRAAVHNLTSSNGTRQGGSTPLMELYKNASGDHSDSLLRKLRELYVASDLSQRMSSPEIFEAWVNRINFGVSQRNQNLYGLETAALEIFGKQARDLNLAESSILAAIIPLPARLQKLQKSKRNEEIWLTVKKLQSVILDNVLTKNPNRFSASEIEQAKRTEIVFANSKAKAQPTKNYATPLQQIAADEFSDFRRRQKLDQLSTPFNELITLIGETDVNEEISQAAQKSLSTRLPAIQKQFPPLDSGGKPANDSLIGVAAISDNETGAIIALAVTATDPKREISKMFANTGVNPCSQKKPFDYACAIEDGKITLSQRFNPGDCKLNLKNGKVWTPSRGVGDNSITVAEGLTGSDDGLVTCVVDAIGVDRSVEFYGKATGNYAKPLVSPIGETEFPSVVTIGFGAGLETSTLEFLQYSRFVRNGFGQTTHVLTNVYKGTDKVPLKFTSESPKQLFSPETAYLVFYAMRGVVGVGPFGQSGTAKKLPFSGFLQKHPEVEMGCKTGSGSHNVGITCVSPKFTVTIQIYYANHSRFKQVGGNDAYAASTAGFVWSDLMFEVLRISPELFTGKISKPAGISEFKIDLMQNCQSEDGVLLPFKKGTQPPECPVEETLPQN